MHEEGDHATKNQLSGSLLQGDGLEKRLEQWECILYDQHGRLFLQWLANGPLPHHYFAQIRRKKEAPLLLSPYTSKKAQLQKIIGPGGPGWLPTQVPGSQGALLLPSPLRTARKPFGLCRSSLSQGPSRDPVGRYAHHLHDTGLGLTGVTRRRPHQQQAAVICSVSQASCSDGLVRRHPREVSPLSRGMISPGGSTPIRSITGRHSLPPSSSTRRPIGNPLAEGLPREEDDGLTTFHG